MKITKYRCEQCSRETEDRYSEVGWITMGQNRGSDFIVFLGRNNGGSGVTVYVDKQDMDFCCLTCFVAWMRARAEGKVDHLDTRRRNIPFDLWPEYPQRTEIAQSKAAKPRRKR